VNVGATDNNFDLIVIGAGFCGSIIALKAAELGLSVKILDSQDAYPDEFRAEKLESDQYEALEDLGLIDLVRPNDMNFISEVRALKRNQDKVIPCHKHRGMDYSATVNSFRSVLRVLGLLEVAKVSQVHDSPGACEVVLADGRSMRSKLCVVANGVGKALRTSLGLSSHEPNALISTTFGFDIEPASDKPFPFQAFNVYPERFTPGLQYVTFFPIGDRMRCNLFTCWKPGSIESKRLRTETLSELRRHFPLLEKRIGPFRLSTKVQAFTTHYYQQSWSHLHNVILVGDAYQSVSPATGVGLSKCLCDVQACMELLQNFAADEAVNLDCALYYQNPMKRRVDENAYHRWHWANESSTSRSIGTVFKRLKRSQAAAWVRQLIDYSQSADL
jgi:2-polyprenyl-6-methoxyphenol hydroxylase-like FAD-dependent oxidoreductase